jgi:hypothetical protein
MPNRNGAGVSKRFGQFASWETVAQAVRHQARLERFSGPSGWNSGAAARWQSAALRRGQLSARKRPRASWRCGAFLPLPVARPRVSQPVARNSAAHGVAPTPKRPAAAGGFAAVPAFAGRHAPGSAFRRRARRLRSTACVDGLWGRSVCRSDERRNLAGSSRARLAFCQGGAARSASLHAVLIEAARSCTSLRRCDGPGGFSGRGAGHPGDT